MRKDRSDTDLLLWRVKIEFDRSVLLRDRVVDLCRDCSKGIAAFWDPVSDGNIFASIHYRQQEEDDQQGARQNREKASHASVIPSFHPLELYFAERLPMDLS